MDIIKKDFEEMDKLAKKILELLPLHPENVGVPILALELIKAQYLEYVRLNVWTNDRETLENLLRHTEILANRIFNSGKLDV